MIKKLKENNTIYKKKCKYCKSLFTYTHKDCYSNWGWDNKNKIIECPYCRINNYIHIKLRYRGTKKVNLDYKKKFETLENNYNIQNNKLLKLKSKLEDYNIIESEYKNTLQDISNLNEQIAFYKKKSDITKKTLNSIQDYIDEILDNGKRSNFIASHLKNIQEIIKRNETK